MVKTFTRSTILTMLGFICAILILGFCVLQEFNIFDIGYLIVLITYFIRYVWVKLHED